MTLDGSKYLDNDERVYESTIFLFFLFKVSDVLWAWWISRGCVPGLILPLYFTPGVFFSHSRVVLLCLSWHHGLKFWRWISVRITTTQHCSNNKHHAGASAATSIGLIPKEVGGCPWPRSKRGYKGWGCPWERFRGNLGSTSREGTIALRAMVHICWIDRDLDHLYYITYSLFAVTICCMVMVHVCRAHHEQDHLYQQILYVWFWYAV